MNLIAKTSIISAYLETKIVLILTPRNIKNSNQKFLTHKEDWKRIFDVEYYSSKDEGTIEFGFMNIHNITQILSRTSGVNKHIKRSREKIYNKLIPPEVIRKCIEIRTNTKIIFSNKATFLLKLYYIKLRNLKITGSIYRKKFPNSSVP